MDEVVIRAWREVFGGWGRHDLVEWASIYRVLTTAESAYPGVWRWERTPYMVEIARELSRGVREVVLVFGSQLGKTELTINYIGWIIDQHPGPVMVLRPTLDDCETFMRQRLKHLFSLPRLASRVARPESRDEAATVYLREFRGGVVMLAGANSPVRLAGRPVRYLICDEVDRYPDVISEGDPMELARARLTSYGRKARLLVVGTPTVRGKSRVEREWVVSSQAEYWVPCPRCGEKQVLRWTRGGAVGICWEGDMWSEGDFRVYYVCEHCGGRIEESEKGEMLMAGEWRHRYPGRDIRGYHLSSLYAPPGWLSWADIVREWERAMERYRAGDVGSLQVFINTRLAEWWEDYGEQVSVDGLELRVEDWVVLPRRVAVLTAGVDVQENRLEVEVVAWAEGFESWHVWYHVIGIDPLDPGAWRELDRVLEREWETEDGRRLRPEVVCIDSGYRTQEVLEYCARNASRFRLAVKGMYGPGRPIWDKRPRRGRGTRRFGVFYLVGVDTAKDALFSYLRLKVVGPGYCHFPRRLLEEHPDYFLQLTSERRVRVQDKSGRIYYRWRAVEHRRTECLDCRVYALAAVHAWLAAGHTLQYNGDGSAVKREAVQRSEKWFGVRGWWKEGV